MSLNFQVIILLLYMNPALEVWLVLSYCNMARWIVGVIHNILLYTTVGSAPTNLMAVQEGPTGIRVSWTPPSPFGTTRGYRISYSGGSSGSVDISDRDTDNHLLSGLVNGASYTIFIVGTSPHYYSEEVVNPDTITLSELLQALSSIYI